MTNKGKPIDVEVEATEKLYADFQLTATNPGGHSSLPTADNAIYEIADALGRLEKSPFPFELNTVTRAWFEQVAASETPEVNADIRAMLRTPPDAAAIARLSKNPRFNSTMRTTCVATRLSGGHADNALPQTAQALVNCRILPGHSKKKCARICYASLPMRKLPCATKIRRPLNTWTKRPIPKPSCRRHCGPM